MSLNSYDIDFSHLDRVQHQVMARGSWITEEEFRAESLEAQFNYYRWLLVQAGELADLM